ncbi:hypothetical protein N602_24270 [Mycobacterium avium subsp. hominissuis 10-5606]|nr:hypothetical protein N602_24270 [Mycobacterium avium subsp. hominissuis 10-5606]
MSSLDDELALDDDVEPGESAHATPHVKPDVRITVPAPSASARPPTLPMHCAESPMRIS